MRAKKRHSIRGFSLLEISIVLSIIAMLAGGGIALFAQSLEKRQWDVTIQRMQVIQKTLLDYRRAFNTLPCPAMASIPPDASLFGVGPVATPFGDKCSDFAGEGYIPTFSLGNLAGGGLPVRALQLPEEYAYDGWGRRFMYYVDFLFTENNAFITRTIGSAVGSFTVNDAAGTTTGNAVYVLLSMGPNGHGAYTRYGSARLSSGSTNTQELENCDCTSAGVPDGAYDGVFVQRPYVPNSSNPALIFDDLVVFATRENLNAVTE